MQRLRVVVRKRPERGVACFAPGVEVLVPDAAKADLRSGDAMGAWHRSKLRSRSTCHPWSTAGGPGVDALALGDLERLASETRIASGAKRFVVLREVGKHTDGAEVVNRATGIGRAGRIRGGRGWDDGIEAILVVRVATRANEHAQPVVERPQNG